MNKVNAILPMRAGSERIKDKNVRILHGRPLYEYTVETLRTVESIEQIVVNTDIPEVISRYQKDSKIKVIQRNEQFRGNCNINCVIEDSLSKIDGEHFIQAHATNPLLKAATIERAIRAFFEQSGNCDSLFGVTRFQKRLWRTNGTPFNHDPQAEPTTQNLEPLFEENSCLYIFSRKTFLKRKNRIGERPFLFEISPPEAMDIDNEEEFRLVEKVMQS